MEFLNNFESIFVLKYLNQSIFNKWLINNYHYFMANCKDWCAFFFNSPKLLEHTYIGLMVNEE